MFDMLGALFGLLLKLFGYAVVAFAAFLAVAYVLMLAGSVMQAVEQIKPRRRGREATVVFVLDTLSVAATIALLFWKLYT